MVRGPQYSFDVFYARYRGLDPARHLTRPWEKYDAAVNRFRVKCGGDLEMCVGGSPSVAFLFFSFSCCCFLLFQFSW